MQIGAVFCSCAGQITEKIDFNELRNLISDQVAWVEKFELACSTEAQQKLIELLAERKPEGLIMFACSPQNKGSLFKRIAIQSEINPYMVNIVNIREQVSWVTEHRKSALKKTYSVFRGTLERLKQQKPLFDKEFPVCTDIMIVGGGIAGIKAAISLSKAGRKVYLVEKESSLGGKVVKYEKIFPDLACGPCMLHPVVEEALNSNIDLRLNSELKELKGYYGSLFVKIVSSPIYVNPKKCIGCSACEEVCPVQAIKVDTMSLPVIAKIDFNKCLSFKGQNCDNCVKECPVPETINFTATESEEILKVGAVIQATGFELMDCSQIPELGYKRFQNVYNALEFEEILNSDGPTKGELITEDGDIPQRIAIIHCVGSLDDEYFPYCSKICCQYAFKFNRVIKQSLPQVECIHFVKEIALPGKNAYKLYLQAIKDPLTKILRYQTLKDLRVDKEDSLIVFFKNNKIPCDIIVLCPAVASDKKIEDASGVFLTGSAKEAMTIQEAITDAMAQTGEIFLSLKESCTITKEPFIAKIDNNKCSSCGICLSQCPYMAVEIENNKPKIIEILCEGCGICVASCPSIAIQLDGYSDEEILSEIDGILKGIDEISYGSNSV